MSLTPPDSPGYFSFHTADEYNDSGHESDERPWKDSFPHATADTAFARERINFTRTEAISPLDLNPTQPIPIPGGRQDDSFDLSDLTNEWEHVAGLDPWSRQHWVRLNEDDHVQMSWNDPTGKSDAAVLGVLLQNNMRSVDSEVMSRLLHLEACDVHDRLHVIYKAAQAARVSEQAARPILRSERTHTKIQKKRGPVPTGRNRTKAQKKRGPAPRVPFAKILTPTETSSEEDSDNSDESGCSYAEDYDSSNEGGYSSEQESSGQEGWSASDGFVDTMEM